MDAAAERQGGSRGGETGERRIEGFDGNFPQAGDVRPHQSGADRPIRIESNEHGAVQRQLLHIALVALQRLGEAARRRPGARPSRRS